MLHGLKDTGRKNSESNLAQQTIKDWRGRGVKAVAMKANMRIQRIQSIKYGKQGHKESLAK